MNQFRQEPGTFKGDLRAIRILFAAIVAGAVFFALMILIITRGNGSPALAIKAHENIFLWVAAGVTLVCFIAAWYGYKKRLTVAKDSLISLKDKLNHYRSTLIIYMGLCEVPALSGIILFFITGNYFFLMLTVLMIVAMLVKAPTLKKITNDLALDWQQQQEME